jgi:XTP/dITP diphosphohydrolase
LVPGFADLPSFPELAPTFAENAAGKALHYSRFTDRCVMADDSGLVVTALDGAPGVHSARYAGPGASDADRIAKLQDELRRTAKGSSPDPSPERGLDRALDRSARFVCVIALAARGRVVAVLSDDVRGEILDQPRGAAGFGYDPVFLYPPLGKTFAELREEEKNTHSHRGKAFRKLLEFLTSSPVL